jgi:hypothetical protein
VDYETQLEMWEARCGSLTRDWANSTQVNNWRFLQ